MEAMILAAMASLVAITNTLTDFFKRLFKVDKKWFNELLSWVISIATTFVAWILGFIPAISQPEWAWILFEGVCVGMWANWIYGYDWVKNILDFIFSWIDGKWYVGKKN